MKPFNFKGVFKKFSIIFMLVLLIIASYLSIREVNNDNLIVGGNSELLRAMTYDRFNDGDEKVEGTDNVEFSAFFLRDIDGDGYGDKIKGTCKEIGAEDTLYMEIIVQSAGYLKNGKIQINGKNFYLQASLPKDNELKNNYIDNNVKTIEFENLNNGTQKMILGMVRSGDYTYSSNKARAIGNNINNYSRDDNKIVLTGTYVDENENEIEIIKEIPLEIDWYGTVRTSITNTNQDYSDIDKRINEEKGAIELAFEIRTSENNNRLLLSKNHVEAIIPELNGFKPTSVIVKNNDASVDYNPETLRLTIDKSSNVNEAGIITSSIGRSNTYIVSVNYPIEAYDETEKSTVGLVVPVEEYYEGYNNPNVEFNNPYKSNVAKERIKVTYRESINTEKKDYASIQIGKRVTYPFNRFEISKKKPLNIYNGVSSEEIDDTYIVRWAYSITDSGEKITLKETQNDVEQVSDQFVKTNEERINIDNLTTNKGIYFEDLARTLSDDGTIKVYDEETDSLLVTFTQNGEIGTEKWISYTKDKPYYYEVPVKHIRVEITGINDNRVVGINNIKGFNDEYITNNYTLEEFNTFKSIKSNLVAYKGENFVNETSSLASYAAPISTAIFRASVDKLSTQVTEKNAIITINTGDGSNYNQNAWKNGVFLVKLPPEFLNVEINSVKVNKEEIEIISYEHIENEEGHFIKIYTGNKYPEGYTITIDCNLTPDPRIASVNKTIQFYATNEEVGDYYNKGNDIYDVNGNLNTDEMVYYNAINISLIASNSLITNQTASEFDQDGTIIISPNIAELKPIYGENDREKQTVRIGVQMKNNYVNTISDVVILGKIPFEGNSYVVSGKDLNSEYTTQMKNTGIEVPEELKNKVTIYYSENENPSKDIQDKSNGWMLKENVVDFSKIKTYIIDFGDEIIDKGTEYIFYYTVEIPLGVEFNKISYSHHGIYFCLNTGDGKYKTQTEPGRIGIKIADKYNLILTKYQSNKNKKIQGALYKISKLDENGDIEESKTAITNANGVLVMDNLYVDNQYTIKELKSPNNYELNNDVVKIIGHVNNETGELSIEKLEGTTRDNIHVEKNPGEDYKAYVNVEDKAYVQLHLTLFESGNTATIGGAKFKILGEGFAENGKIVTTNTNGKIDLSGLKIGQEYTLTELKAEGYYLADTIKFKIKDENGVDEIEIIEGVAKSSTISVNNDILTANIEIENEKIPTYDLRINKVKKGSITDTNLNGTKIDGAKFKLYKDNKEIGSYTTNSEGQIYISGLYQYESDKNINQTYILKEVYAPEGYVKASDLVFETSNVFGIINYIETVEKGREARDFDIEGNVVTVTIEDSPAFRLVKKDEETNALLPNTKFAIYNVEDGQSPARNTKNEIVGTREVIKGVEYYTLTTDENGEITADLPDGLYKAVEVEADEKYDISKSTHYFGIGKTKDAQLGLKAEWLNSVGGPKDTIMNSVAITEDGGYVAVGTFQSDSITIGDKTITNHNTDESTDGIIVKYNNDGELEDLISVGGDSNDELLSVVATEDGGYIAVGSFQGTITVGDKTITCSGNRDGLIIKLNQNGDVEWIKKVGTDEYNNNLYSISISEDGSFFVSGVIYGSSITIDGYQIQTSGSRFEFNGIVIKYNSLGEVIWAKWLEKANGAEYEKAVVTSTPDGGCAVAGIYKYSYVRESKIVKYDSSGNVEWSQIIAGAKNVSSIVSDEDNHLVVAGDYSGKLTIGSKTSNPSDKYDGFVIEFASDGDVKWINNVGGNDYDYINSVTKTKDGGFIAAGRFSSDTMVLGEITIKKCGGSRLPLSDGIIVKYSNEGKVEWAQSIAGSDDTECMNSVIENENEEIIIAGYFWGDSVTIGDKQALRYEQSSNSKNGIIIKCKIIELPTLNINKVEDISGDWSESFNSVNATRDGGYIAGGTFGSDSITIGNNTITHIKEHSHDFSFDDGLIVKYNSSHEIEWIQTVLGYRLEKISSVIQTKDDGFIAVGEFSSDSITIGDKTLINCNTNNDNDHTDIFIVKYNQSGEVEWTKSIGGKSSDSVYSTLATTDGGFVVVGYTYSDSIAIGDKTISNYHPEGNSYDYSAGIIVKYNQNGEVEWMQSIGGNTRDAIRSITETKDGDYIVGGYVGDSIEIANKTLNKGGVLIKYSKSGEIKWAKSSVPKEMGSNNVLTTNDGGFLATGNISASVEIGDRTIPKGGIITKYSQDGEMEWIQSLPNNDIDTIATTEDGGFVVGGSYFDKCIGIGDRTLVNYGDGSDCSIIKYDAFGKIEWAEGIHGEYYEMINSISQTTSGNYVVGGAFVSGDLIMNNEILANNQYYGPHNSHTDGMLIEFYMGMSAQEQEELVVKNSRKQFKITTDINKIDGIKGGSISGENKEEYEVVKYGDTSTNPIVITPDENYEIIGITVNGKEWQFEPESDGTYTMPQFDNMYDDKNIVATFALKNNKIIINKKDSVSGGQLSGARFRLDQIEERSEPINSNIIGELQDNSDIFKEVDYDNEVTNVLGNIIDNGTYHFVEKDGKYVPTNSRTYQLENGGTNGVPGVASSYIPIDLTGLDGTYKVVVNAEISSRNSIDYGFATINQSTSAPSYSTTNGRFIYISGTEAALDYESKTVLQGGQIYYLHLGYNKVSTGYSGTDQFIINSVKLFKTKDFTYNFIKTDDNKYESTNTGKNNTVCNSYIPIDLRTYDGKYSLIIDAMISSEGGDIGYVTLTEDVDRPLYNDATGRIIYTSGTVRPKSYETIIDGGKKYYLHLGYYKNGRNASGDDKFTINSINIRLSDAGLYHTEVESNLNGQAITQIPFGKYAIKEIKAPEGYILNPVQSVIEFRSYDGAPHEFTIENDKLCNVIVHHYLKEEDGTYTTIKVAEDELLNGKQGQNYSASFKTDLLNYEPLKDEASGEYIIPDSARGEFSYNDGEVILYYTQRKTMLTVNHYIKGTETAVPLINGDLAETEYIMGKKGEPYSTNQIENELLDEGYEFDEVQGEPNGTYGNNEIIVNYYYNYVVGNLKINKVDVDTQEPLEGIKFGVYREEPRNIEVNESEKIGNKYDKVYADKTNKSDVEPVLYKLDETASFTNVDGKYMPENSMWYVINQNNEFEGHTSAIAYVNIDLRNKSKKDYYIFSTNVEMRNTLDNQLKIRYTDDYASGDYNEITGEHNENYEVVLKGGRIYQLELEYAKWNSLDIEDYVALEMNLYNTENVRIETINEIPYNIVGKATDEEVLIEKNHVPGDDILLPFIENEGVYTPMVCQKFINNNNVNPDDLWSTSSEEVVIIDLSDKEGYYVLTMDLLMQNITDDEFICSVLSDDYEPIYVADEQGNNVMRLTGEHSERYHATLIGGKEYGLLLHYNKNSSSDVEDYVAVSNIKVYKATPERRYIGFEKTDDGKYISNNQFMNNSKAHSVIPIDLKNNKNDVELTINAEISPQWNDYGKIVITDTIDVDHPLTFNQVLFDSNEIKDAQDYMAKLQQGNVYYLHMIYEKNNLDREDIIVKDTFTINSIKLEEKPYTILTTNSEGKAETVLPTNEYTLIELNPKEGYNPIEPQKITLTKSGLDLTIENEKTKGNVIVNHFVEGTEENIKDYDGIEVEPELKKGVYGARYATSPRTDLYDKYELVDMPNETSGEYSETPQTITYYYRIKQYPYKVNYLLKDDDSDDSNNKVLYETKTSEQSYDYGTLINTDNEIISIWGYAYDSTNLSNLKITTNNVINIYYIIDERNTKQLSYAVEYYKDGNIVSEDKVTINQNVQVLQPDTLELGTSLIDSNKYDGYKLDHTDPEILPDRVNNGDVIKVYYTKRNDLQYTIHYKEQGTNKSIAEEKIVENQIFGEIISESAIDITGYDKIDPTATEVEITTGVNEYTFYYKKAKFNYKVEYYYDDVIDDTKTEVIEATYQDVISSYEEKEDNGYIYYKIEGLPLTISSNENDNTIKVYYVTDNNQNKTLEYTVEYYKDGVLQTADTQLISKEVYILADDTILVDKNKINTTDKYEYYTFEKTEPEEVPMQITSGGVIKVYYVKTKYPYRIEYYYDNSIDNSKTEHRQANIGESINEYINKAEDEYVLEKVDGMPLEITANTEENVIRVYYSSKRTITIKCIDKTSGKILKTEEKAGVYGQRVSIEAEEIDGYTCIEQSEKNEYIFGAENQITTFYYAKNTQVIVKYVDKETGKEIAKSQKIDGYVGKGYSTEKINVDGYDYLSSTDNITGKMTENTIDVIYYYSKPVEKTYSSYTINYIDADTGNTIRNSKVIKTQEIGTIVYAKSLIEVIDNYTFDHFDKDSITIKEGENTITLYYVKNEQQKNEESENKQPINEQNNNEQPTKNIIAEKPTGKITTNDSNNRTLEKEPNNMIRISNTGKSIYIDKILGAAFIVVGCMIIVVNRIYGICSNKEK